MSDDTNVTPRSNENRGRAVANDFSTPPAVPPPKKSRGIFGPALLVFLIAAGATIAVTIAVHRAAMEREQTRFNHGTEQLQQIVESGLDKYLTLLDSVRAFAVARITMNPAQFHSFIEALALREKFKGIVGVGLALKVPKSQEAELVQKVRKDYGLPDFHIWPASEQTNLCPLIFMEPRDAQNLAFVGYDLFANSELSATVTAAGESGLSTASPSILLDSTSAPKRKKGFVILFPIYRGGAALETAEDRRTNVSGFVHCAFDTQALLQSILSRNTNSTLPFRIYDGAAASVDSLIFESQSWPSSSNSFAFSKIKSMAVAGRPWTLNVASKPEFVRGLHPSSITLAVGLALSTMLAGFVFSQTRAREAAERHAFELRRSETKIQDLNAHLEKRVITRTAELEAAVDELKAFSYSVSHDLRAPLRHIDGYVSLLAEHPNIAGDEAAQRHAKIVSKSARQMGLLVDALLNFSRLGWTPLTMNTNVDVNEIVREVCQMLSPDTEGRSIEWKIANLPSVTADRTLLRQVFANLLSNAIKYSAPRSPAVIEIGSEDRGAEILFFVRDNGVGFDMNYAGKLFSVFQRLHSDKEFEGTGIGLANIRKIISRHGGRTWAEGATDQGAAFFFTLPKAGQPAAKSDI